MASASRPSRRVAELGGEVGLHQQVRRACGPGLRMPCGSNTAFSLRCKRGERRVERLKHVADLVGRPKQRRMAAVLARPTRALRGIGRGRRRRASAARRPTRSAARRRGRRTAPSISPTAATAACRPLAAAGEERMRVIAHRRPRTHRRPRPARRRAWRSPRRPPAARRTSRTHRRPLVKARRRQRQRLPAPFVDAPDRLVGRHRSRAWLPFSATAGI